ncbi:aspartate kinase [Oceanobacillus profundus]|uniref:aspartate kinase n=1 Tax=Oceanobacillus TaxID=182709 RepID=UPI000BA50E96|nr:aspartate kinase [Oceanobacillus profundus]MDO6450808.1 aspartate kinase [Oceanobacillus profundus]PAE31164.1 aspartate kinase [Paenibacillus sp. 7884-2]
MKVAKFGGSSVANAEQLRKVGNIIKSDPKRKFIVVSAPGKRFKNDTKVTDLLIQLGNAYHNQQNYEVFLVAILERFQEIINDLEIDLSLLSEIENNIKVALRVEGKPESKMDAIKAIGEDSSAKILSAYLNQNNISAQYMNPKDAGIFVSEEPGNAQILPESFELLYKLREKDHILVIPGFFGYSKTGKLVTFSRGGSDITGSIVAAGVKAEIYENFTDVDSVYSVNPNIVNNPKEITTLTYKEMRELSYAGFSVFHDEALIPAFREKIPVCIKNTNNPDAPGTFIIAEKEASEKCVVGIASDTGFCSLYVSKYLMNREVGFGRRLLNIFEDEGISFEHAPSGIDDMSVIFRVNNFTKDKEKIVVDRIKDELKVDTVSLHRDLAVIMVVGEGLVNTVGVAGKAASAFAKANVNIEMINQGSSEVSMMFGIKDTDIDAAIRSLYQTFFE